MKRISSAILASVLMLGAVGCSAARTSSSAPDSAAQPEADLTEPTAGTNQDDATSELRRRQLNSDIRASEQRHDAVGGSERTDRDLESEVRSKLEANLPASELAIEAKEGVVTITGTVVDQAQLDKIDRLAREINGVKDVNVKVNVASAAEPEAPAANSDQPLDNHTDTQAN